MAKSKNWEAVLGWHVLEEDRRCTRRELMRKTHLNAEQLDRMLAEVKEHFTETPYDSIEYLKSRAREIDEALLTSCRAKSPGSLKIYYQLIDELKEKTEVTHKFDADTIARLNDRADRQLDEYRKERVGGNGVDNVSKVPALLPGDLREDTRP